MTRLTTALILIATFFSFQKISAQTAEDVFKTKYPKLFAELKSEGDKEVSKLEIADFRNELKQLVLGYDEIVRYENGGASPENLTFFEYREIKGIDKDGQVKELKKIVLENQNQIKIYLSDKTKYGADSVRCIELIQLIKDELKIKNYEKSYEYWGVLYKYHPLSSPKYI